MRDAAVKLFDERGYHATSMRDIASELNIRAPSLYNHVDSKQDLLQQIMFEDIDLALKEFHEAVATTDDVVEQIRRAAEAHVRHHATHRREAKVNTSEILSLVEPAQTQLKARRMELAREWREMLERANAEGRCAMVSPKVAAGAILDMGIGVSHWFRDDGEFSIATLAHFYGDMALRIAGAGTPLAPRPDGPPRQ
jgi:AcrR family transcriptional regulator